jgi:hypothetical protein
VPPGRLSNLRCSSERLRRRRIDRHQGGATAVEFAMVAPVFLLLVFVIAELALVFLAEEMLERATKESARLVRTGQVHANGVDKEEFEKLFCGNLVFLSCSEGRFHLDVRSYDSFAAMDIAPPVTQSGGFRESGDPEFGEANDIVVVRAYYQWPTSPIIGELTLANLENGRRLISAFAAFRNEPFPTAPRSAMAASTSAPGTGAAAGGVR